jgi:hypothetical protein
MLLRFDANPALAKEELIPQEPAKMILSAMAQGSLG